MAPIFTYLRFLAIGFFVASNLGAQSAADLVEITSIDPTIQIDLRYATKDNITGKVLYHSEFRARLRRGVAEKLRAAQETLRSQGYGLKVWDSYRPLAAQRALYAVISDPRFVAEPGQRSMHNRGVAVDVTLVDASGNELIMPTKFDEMSESAFYNYRGKNSLIAKNLSALQKAMKENGFYGCRTEWWHFFVRNWDQYPNFDMEGLEQGTPTEKK